MGWDTARSVEGRNLLDWMEGEMDRRGGHIMWSEGDFSLITEKSRLLVRRYPQLPLRPVNLTAICLVGMCLCASVDLQRKDGFPEFVLISRSFMKNISLQTCRVTHMALLLLTSMFICMTKVKMYSASRLTWTCAVRLVWGVCAGAGFLSLWGKDTQILTKQKKNLSNTKAIYKKLQETSQSVRRVPCRKHGSYGQNKISCTFIDPGGRNSIWHSSTKEQTE